MIDDEPAEINVQASRWIFLGLVCLMAVGLLTYAGLRPQPTPPPPEIAGDRLLVEGRSLYLERCVSCHGTSGRGDGPIAKGLSGPPPGDLTDAHWKHGDQPAQVLAVITRGVADAAMPGWAGTFTPDQISSLAAYTYHLAGQPVPDDLRGR